MEGKNNFSGLQIILKDNKSEYHLDDEVSGVIKFELKGPTTGVNIKILLISVSEVQWIESTQVIISEYQTSGYLYQEKTRRVNQIYSLPKKYENLSEGSHEIPFNFTLPAKDIPSTFTGPHGSIKYYIEVIDEETGVEGGRRVGLKELTVNAPIRQNLDVSIGCSKEKEFGILSLGSGKVTLYASFARRGWTPGENLHLDLIIENQSTMDATPRATLFQTQIYMCNECHKALEIPLSEPIVGKKVERHKNVSETLVIPIPKDLPPTIRSDLIRVKYFVHVTLDIPHAFDIHVNIPLILTNKSVSAIQ